MNHHFVPQFYLKGFLDPAAPATPTLTPYLWVVDFAKQLVKRRAPHNAAALTDYYAIEDESGQTSHEIEAALSEIESNATKVIAAISTGHYRLTKEEREDLAILIAMQVTRVPAFRNRVEAFTGEIGDLMFRMMAHEPESFLRDFRASGAGEGMSDADVEGLRQAALSGEAFLFRGHPTASLRQAMTTALDVIGPMILQMDWHFSVAPAGSMFITSDNPAFWNNPKTVGLWGRGLGSRDAELTYPLTANVKLLGNWQGVRGVEHVSAEYVTHMNGLVSLFANQFVFAPSEDTAREALNARPATQTPDKGVLQHGQLRI